MSMFDAKSWGNCPSHASRDDSGVQQEPSEGRCGGGGLGSKHSLAVKDWQDMLGRHAGHRSTQGEHGHQGERHPMGGFHGFGGMGCFSGMGGPGGAGGHRGPGGGGGFSPVGDSEEFDPFSQFFGRGAKKSGHMGGSEGPGKCGSGKHSAGPSNPPGASGGSSGAATPQNRGTPSTGSSPGPMSYGQPGSYGPAGSGGPLGITPGQLPAPNGEKVVNETIVVKAGEVFDGQGMHFVAGTALGDGGQSEGQKPIFRLEPGATLVNVQVSGADGIHAYGDATLQDVWWRDVGEDAFTLKAQGNVHVIGGGAFNANDKIFQLNAGGSILVEGFTAEDFGKAFRTNGGKEFDIDITVVNSSFVNGKYAVAQTDARGATINLLNNSIQGVKQIAIAPDPSQVRMF